jgi:hypothetical protein
MDGILKASTDLTHEFIRSLIPHFGEQLTQVARKAMGKAVCWALEEVACRLEKRALDFPDHPLVANVLREQASSLRRNGLG